MPRSDNMRSLGQTQGGIRTEADIRARCSIDPDTGCWLWLGACSVGKKHSKPVPVCYHATVGRVGTVRRVLRDMAGLPPVRRVWSACGNCQCVRPDHGLAGSETDYGAWVAAQGLWKRLPRKIAASRVSARRYDLTDDQVRAVRLMRPSEAAREFGLSYGAAWKIHRRQAWTHVPDKAPSFGAARHAVDSLPPGYVSALDPSQCRPWAQAAVQGRAA